MSYLGDPSVCEMNNFIENLQALETVGHDDHGTSWASLKYAFEDSHVTFSVHSRKKIMVS